MAPRANWKGYLRLSLVSCLRNTELAPRGPLRAGWPLPLVRMGWLARLVLVLQVRERRSRFMPP
jgi:hypothetical protein